MSDRQLNIGVIGAGVAGITAAYLLARRHQVTLLERNEYIGGHTNTIVIPEGPDAGTPVDTGFIVLNDRTYPRFRRLLAHLDVRIRDADMSFGFCCERTGLQYAGTSLNGLFAQRGNLAKPGYYALWRDIFLFNARAVRDLKADRVGERTLGEYVEVTAPGRRFRDDYLLPMGAAIWSTSAEKMLEFPAQTFLRFFYNHGLLILRDRPQWQTVAGGSHSYVKAFLRDFRGDIRTDARIKTVRRGDKGVTVLFENNEPLLFDRIVIATHADQALRLLADPSPLEQELLGAWEYNHNPTILHTDTSFLPSNRRAWASWNYRRERDSEGPLSVTYDMNRLQGLKTRKRYCVTLNARREIPERHVIKRIDYTHPLYTPHSLASQERLPELNGRMGTYFAGSYFGYGFHEDAVKAGEQVGRAFGESL